MYNRGGVCICLANLGFNEWIAESGVSWATWGLFLESGAAASGAFVLAQSPENISALCRRLNNVPQRLQLAVHF